MPRDGLDRIREALARLPTASRAELREDWLKLYRSEPPTRLGRDLLIAAIAYGLQEQVLGGLRPELRRRLRKIAEQVSQGGEPTISTLPCLKPGTRLLREWQGRTHEVLVSDDGFVWQQARYRSLSHIARAITGTRWSGPVFFGLKPRAAPRTRCRDGGVDGAR
jgi:hypothetical protein